MKYLALLIALTTAASAQVVTINATNIAFIRKIYDPSDPSTRPINFHGAEVTAISTITNVTHYDNSEGCATCAGIAKHHWALAHFCDKGGLPYIPPTEKWTVTNVIRRYKLKFFWLTQYRELVEDELIFSTTNRWKLEWKEVK